MRKSSWNAVWSKALKSCADPERATHFLRLLRDPSGWRTVQKWPEVQARTLCAVFSGSQTLSAFLLSDIAQLEQLAADSLQHPRRKQGLQKDLAKRFASDGKLSETKAAFTAIRQFHREQMLRIGARDLAGFGDVSEITHELSDLADICLTAIWQICLTQLEQRYGCPWHQDAEGIWHRTAACVLGLGKLGGQELNYSSDVDLMFLYSDEGRVFRELPKESSRQKAKPRKADVSAQRVSDSTPATLTNHQFYNRVAEAFVTELSRLSDEGTLYRVDLRLRPEGDIGPLTRSLQGFENYYAQWGQTWERMMLIKTRCVAGDEGLAAEFLEMIQPFRYPRSVNEGVLREVGAMKDRIEAEVVRSGELDLNVKLGRGGIREIEFIAQALQLLHAGRQPFLQGSQTLPTLAKLVQYELISPATAEGLRDAYCFLRRLEHRLQMDQHRQTHTVPADRRSRERIARLMGCGTLKKFEQTWRGHQEYVRRSFDEVLGTEGRRPDASTALPAQFEDFEQGWKTLLQEHSFKDLDRAYRVLREFVEGPGYVHVSPRTAELAMKLIPRLFGLCHKTSAKQQEPGTSANLHNQSDVATRRIPLSDPDRVVTRLDTFISVYGARSTLFELWNSNPAIFDLLMLLFDRSEFLAELAIRTPDLVDELVTSGRLRQRKSAQETLRDLRHGLGDADQHLWLRRYHQAELMRIGLRDILGLADFEQYLTELSALADACLQYALESVMRRNKLKTPPFCIIGLGKLGGAEIDYGSDLDIIFVTDAKPGSSLQKLSKLAVQVMELMSSRTEQGIVFQTDARLRPDGEKGLLVNSLPAYEDYYRQRAGLWEIQSLTRTRPIAGDGRAGEQFQILAATLTNFARPPGPLLAYTTKWKAKINDMRMRIEKERTPQGKDELAIKTGSGGLMDAEFIAQALCLENGWREPNTLRALERGRQEGFLPNPTILIENYRRLRRVEGILRRWSYEGETVLPDDPAPYYRVSVRCGFNSPDEFRNALASYRRAIRDIYLQVFRA